MATTDPYVLDRAGRCTGPCAALDLDPPILALVTSRARYGGGDRLDFERAYCGLCGTPAAADPYLLDEFLADRDVETAAACDAYCWQAAKASDGARLDTLLVALVNVDRFPCAFDRDEAAAALAAIKAEAGW